MMTLTGHIENVRQKPDHVRKQIALGVATIITAVIALIWLGASVATGVFALKETSFADATSGVAAAAQATTANTNAASSLLGAASAALTGVSKGPAHIEIIDTGKSSTLDTKKAAPAPQPTVLPF